VTPFEISSSYGTSILVRRWFGWSIDLVVLSAILAPIAILPEEVARVVAIPEFIVAALYFPVLEGLLGRTLGKVVSGTVVVDEFGGRPRIDRAAIRAIAGLLECNPLLAGGLPAAVIIWFSPTRQRWGDLLARTFVLRAQDLPRLMLDESGKQSG